MRKFAFMFVFTCASVAWPQVAEINMRPSGVTDHMRLLYAHENNFTGLGFASSGRQPYLWSAASPITGAMVLPPTTSDFFGLEVHSGRAIGQAGARSWLLGGPGAPAPFLLGERTRAVTTEAYFGNGATGLPGFTASPGTPMTPLPLPPSYTSGSIVGAWGNQQIGLAEGGGNIRRSVIYRNAGILTTIANSEAVDLKGAAFSIDRANTTTNGDVTDYGYVTPAGSIGYFPVPAGWEQRDIFPGMTLLRNGSDVVLANVDAMINPISFKMNNPSAGPFVATSVSTDGMFWYVSGYQSVAFLDEPIVRLWPVMVPPVFSLTTLLNIQFSPVDFTLGQLSGQSGWISFPGGVASAFQMGPGRHGQVYGVNVSAISLPAGSAYSYRPITYDSATTPEKVIAGSVNVRIRSNNLNAATVTTAGLSVYSGPTELGRFMMDPRGYLTLSNGVETASGLEYGMSSNWMRLSLELDFQNRVMRGYVNGVPYPGVIPIPGTSTSVTDFDLTVTGGGDQDVVFDDYIVRADVPMKKVALRANPQDHVAPGSVPTRWSVWADGSPIISDRDTPFPYLNIEVPQSTSTITFTCEASHWTRRRRTTVVPSGMSTFQVSLPNGDADESGEVDAADIDAVIADFGGSGAMTDLDGSGEVDAADIDICISNFGAADE